MPGSSDERVHVLLCRVESVTGSHCLRRKLCSLTTNKPSLVVFASTLRGCEGVILTPLLQLADLELSWVCEETAATRPITASLSSTVHSIIASSGSTANKQMWFCTDGERDREGVYRLCQKEHHHKARH